MYTESHQQSGSSVVDPILEVRNASVTFDMDRGESRVLDETNMDIDREEVLGIVGESGSGKSMFASALLDAVVQPGRLSGSVRYHPEDGEPVDVTSLPEDQLKSFRWEHISMVFQGAMSSFNPTTTIETHFKETLLAHDTDVEEGLEHAREILSDLYLEPDRVLNSYPHELSGGMTQRALIALSLVLEPEVLVMDEPTAALDLLMQRSILELLKDLKSKYDLTLVFITHDLALISELADRLAVMYAFDFIEIGPTEDLLDHAAHPYTRALLNAVPNLEAPIARMEPIDGAAPDPVNVPEGCRYHPRCPLADSTCRESDPGFYDATDTHDVACHHWETAQTEIPLSLDDGQDGEASADVSATWSDHQDEDPLVSMESIEVHFGDDDGPLSGYFSESETVLAVDDVDLNIYENDVVALVGESGCGKTTLGKTAVGLQRPTGGSITYRGQDIWDAKDGNGDVSVPFTDIRRALQIIHQDPGSALNPYHRVHTTLAEPLKRWYPKLDKQERKARIYGMLKTVGITPAEDYAQRYPHQLSGGEQQRIALIRALLMNPDLILADEAISALDVSLRVETMDLMLELQDRFDTSFLFISHDLSNARYLAEKADGRIGIMYLGELVEIGPVEQILQNPKHPYTKALRWATPNLVEEDRTEMPMRTIDIPDPVDPPSGCRFHTRCPEAREVCAEQTPTLETSDHCASCFRTDDSHEYWDSPSLTDDT